MLQTEGDNERTERMQLDLQARAHLQERLHDSTVLVQYCRVTTFVKVHALVNSVSLTQSLVCCIRFMLNHIFLACLTM